MNAISSAAMSANFGACSELRQLDAVHGERARVDLAFRIQVAMEFLAGGPAIERFRRSRFR